MLIAALNIHLYISLPSSKIYTFPATRHSDGYFLISQRFISQPNEIFTFWGSRICTISTSLLVSVQKQGVLCKIIFDTQMSKPNCINDIKNYFNDTKYGYRLNARPVLSRKLMYTLKPRNEVSWNLQLNVDNFLLIPRWKSCWNPQSLLFHLHWKINLGKGQKRL